MDAATEESTGTALVLSPTQAEPEIDALVVLEEIHTKLGSITTVNEAKELADQAGAVRYYAKRAQKTLVVQNRCAYAKVCAERRAGELPVEMDLLRGRPTKTSTTRRLIDDFGINYNQSSDWQALTAVSLDVLAGWRQQCDDKKEEFTSAYVKSAGSPVRARVELWRLAGAGGPDPMDQVPRASQSLRPFDPLAVNGFAESMFTLLARTRLAAIAEQNSLLPRT